MSGTVGDAVPVRRGRLGGRRRGPDARDARDPVTGLPARAAFRDRLERAVRRAGDRGATLALLVVDLDRFTEINVALGHDAGDALLREVGRRLVERIGASGSVANLGADEFAVILAGADTTGACRTASEIIAAISEPFAIEGHQVGVDASVGVATYPDGAPDADTLLHHADVAMYAAKRAASGCATYAPEQDRQLDRPLALLAELRDGLARDELTLQYQPQVSLRTGAIVGMEALVRWRHPRHGLLLPGEFVPLAERTTLMGALSRWVLERALRECRVCVPYDGRLRTSVNLSVRDLRDPDLPAVVAGLLDRYAAGAVWLSIEVTESAVMADAERVRETLLRLRELGVRLAIDDFGSGYSSLAYLKRLPVDALKIDGALVSGIGDDATSRAIVKAVVDLGHSLGLEVVAEGIEDARALEVLRQLGCDTAQGHFVSPPLDLAGLERWMAAQAQSFRRPSGRSGGGQGGFGRGPQSRRHE